MRFDLQNQFPLITTKKVHWKSVVLELLWFLKGSTNGTDLLNQGVKIWEQNGTREYLDKKGFYDREEHNLGPIYGHQWRSFGKQWEEQKNYNDIYFSDMIRMNQISVKYQGVDQISNLVQSLQKNPYSRRHIISAWNPVDLDIMALPPCHVLSQYHVKNGKLSCTLYQRSADMGLGVPFNIASYSLLTCMLAQQCNLQRGEFIHMLGDYHIYTSHIPYLKNQIKKIPYPFPQLIINKKNSLFEYEYNDFNLINYQSHKKQNMPLVV